MTTWIFKTNDSPLAAARQFLQTVWAYANLEGMVVPVYQPGYMTAKMNLINDPAQLQEANPFVPLMQFNAGKLVAQLACEMPNVRLAAVLRACELRAFDECVKMNALNLENWLIIGVECLACFPAQDFEWRVQKAGSVEQLTDLVLRNARQGGIALDRFRSACQMCSKPEPSHFDLCLELLGLPAKEMMLVSAKDDAIARKFHLHEITDGPASPEVLVLHDHMLKTIEERRQRARERKLRELFPHLPANLDELVIFLLECQPCRNCIEACPVHPEELISAIDHGAISRSLAKRWLMSCAECGMCEQACPKVVPLAAIMNRISRELKSEVVAV
jgi:formate dehydrogenase subunit beta